MNRSLPLLVLTAALLVPAAAHAQSITDASDGDGASTSIDAGDAAVDSGFAPVTPGPDAAATSAVVGCDGAMINAPCSLGVGAAGFCFPDGVDGSDSELECVVDSDADPGGCNLAATASSAGAIGGLAVVFGLVLAGMSRAGRRRRR